MHSSDCIAIKDIRPGLKNINVVFIVLDVGSATVTKENREVRNFKVGDPTACINVSIWDEPGKYIVPGDIIRMSKGYASIWRNCLTLYSGKNGEVVRLGDFCMVFNEQLNMSEPKRYEAPSLASTSLGMHGATGAAGSSGGGGNNNNSNNGSNVNNGGNNNKTGAGKNVGGGALGPGTGTGKPALLSSLAGGRQSPAMSQLPQHLVGVGRAASPAPGKNRGVRGIQGRNNNLKGERERR